MNEKASQLYAINFSGPYRCKLIEGLWNKRF